MKKILLVCFLILCVSCKAQEKFDKSSVINFQNEMNESFKDPKKSPLKEEDLLDFKEIDFYRIDERYYIKATFVGTPNEKPFPMPTTTARKPMYVKYGELHFYFDGEKYSLDVFKNVDGPNSKLMTTLFLPFTDLTSGVESYGGGRYIDLEYPKDNVVYIDFNKAYNPYCAYNEKYSCPITPDQNDLKFEVKAGVKKFK